MSRRKPADNRYAALVETIFRNGYKDGLTEVPFHRDELTTTAKRLRIELPKNLGDAIYAIRYRMALPHSICSVGAWPPDLPRKARPEVVSV